MATARLRKTFHYPSSSSSSDSDAALDEEHQEALIHSLRAHDHHKTTLYRHLALLFPLLPALYFLLTLFSHPSSNNNPTIPLLCLTSLGCTAWILHYMPIEAAPPERKEGKRAGLHAVEEADKKSPVERWIVPLNAMLAGLLLVAAGMSWRPGEGEEGLRRGLPMVVFALTMFVRQQLAPLDLEELQRARYELKGA